MIWIYWKPQIHENLHKTVSIVVHAFDFKRKRGISHADWTKYEHRILRQNADQHESKTSDIDDQFINEQNQINNNTVFIRRINSIHKTF